MIAKQGSIILYYLRHNDKEKLIQYKHPPPPLNIFSIQLAEPGGEDVQTWKDSGPPTGFHRRSSGLSLHLAIICKASINVCTYSLCEYKTRCHEKECPGGALLGYTLTVGLVFGE